MAAAFRLFSKMDTQQGDAAQLLPGGYLKFYTAHTLTPKNVYGEKALSTNNGSTISLDSSSRPVDDIWGSGSYFVELYDSANVKQGEKDDVEIPGGEATALPALVDGEFLTNDGAVMEWAAISQLPDPTGSAGKILGTDGATWFPTNNTTISATSTLAKFALTASPTQSFAILRGTGSIASSGAHTAGGSVSFGTTFLAAPTVMVTGTDSGGITSDGYLAVVGLGTVSTTGFDIEVNVNEAETSAGTNINTAVNFAYVAFGLVTT